MSKTGLPQFANPPVVETVIGVQFAPLEGYTTAHAGWFWVQHLGRDWETVDEVPRLEEYREMFGADREFSVRRLRVRSQPEPNRIRFRRGMRMLQVQSSRFVFNWIRGDGDAEYPSYDTLLPEFREKWASFQEFVEEAGLGGLSPDHWEVTYVNLLAKDESWQKPEDWSRLLPGLVCPTPTELPLVLDGLSGRWQYVIGDRQGRLRVKVQHGKRDEGTGEEVLKVELLARGPIDRVDGLESGLDLGHEAIVSSFGALTGQEAQEKWEKIDA